jgi:hypothetical protein
MSSTDIYRIVRLEVSTAVTMRNGVFWDVTPCGFCKNRRFGGDAILHFSYCRLREVCDYDQYSDLSLTPVGATGHLEHISFTIKPHVSGLAGGRSADCSLEGCTKPQPIRILSFRLSKTVKTWAFLSPERARAHTHTHTHTKARTHTQICNVCVCVWVYIYMCLLSLSSYTPSKILPTNFCFICLLWILLYPTFRLSRVATIARLSDPSKRSGWRGVLGGGPALPSTRSSRFLYSNKPFLINDVLEVLIGGENIWIEHKWNTNSLATSRTTEQQDIDYRQSHREEWCLLGCYAVWLL